MSGWLYTLNTAGDFVGPNRIWGTAPQTFETNHDGLSNVFFLMNPRKVGKSGNGNPGPLTSCVPINFRERNLCLLPSCTCTLHTTKRMEKWERNFLKKYNYTLNTIDHYTTSTKNNFICAMWGETSLIAGET